MRLVFFGTPEIAVPYLRRLAAEHEILAVVTQPDRPRGRGRCLQAPAVKQEALCLGLPVLQPSRVRRERICDLDPLRRAQVTVVVAYGQILPAELCTTDQRPAINVHYSLLPDLRGPAPVQRALLGGRQTTGVTVQYVAEELDSGDLILQQEVDIQPDDDTGALFARLNAAGVPLLSRALQLLARGEAPRVPQDPSRATYAPLLSPQEGALDWRCPASDLRNRIRAFSPQPGAYCHHLCVRLKVYAPALAGESEPGALPGQITQVTSAGMQVQTGEGQILIGEVQPAGRRRMSAADYARGARLSAGSRLENG
jgi:methionyl-tRNA formyltransferase